MKQKEIVAAKLEELEERIAQLEAAAKPKAKKAKKADS